MEQKPKRHYKPRTKGKKKGKEWLYEALGYDPYEPKVKPIDIYDRVWHPCEYMLDPPELTCMIHGNVCAYRNKCNYDECAERVDMNTMRTRRK